MRFCATIVLFSINVLFSLAPAWCQIAKPEALTPHTVPAAKPALGTVKIPAQAISELERSFDSRLRTMAGVNEPAADLMGDTRGIQLDGYGLVFTSEVSLVVTPTITPFIRSITPEMAARIHKLRVERMPLLKAAMKEMMRNVAAACSQLPANQQIVLAVRLYYGAWEDTAGMPAQVMMKADRAAAATGNVDTEER
jgi:hypothetical protein